MNYRREAHVVRDDLAIPSINTYTQVWHQIPGEAGDKRSDGHSSRPWILANSVVATCRPGQLTFIEQTIRNDGGEHAQRPTEGYEPILGDTRLIQCPSLETPIGFLVPHQANVLRSVADPLRKWWALNGPGIADRLLAPANALLIVTGG